ncbi:iron-containing alcohol dehydrogenase [Methylobacterium sp. J-077]|uniref:iron-containing alcohol dehydrogenase n=1 Tax=Methylobacterium sp. J-077 TaxID=2836656 RepID=UPI001FB90F98|nr:iron-containing alcohol dehydrogenase [Methylobacterium sp. J-077]MCJ2126639.1 iron-containing alcohol dehydrogenase [Methylobacterium sp. J-077]
MAGTGGDIVGEDVEAGALDLKCHPRVLYGADLREALPDLAQERRWGRVLPVVTRSLMGVPIVVEALARLGVNALDPFIDLVPHTPFDVVLTLVERIQEARADAVAVVGGGSAIDAVKIAALAAATRVTDAESLLALRAGAGADGVQQPSPGARTEPAIVAVPTTLSGAEFGLIGGATQGGIKHLFRADTLAPDVVVYDPALALHTPLGLWLSTGIRAVDHAAETVLSRDANPFTDALALRALRLLRAGLEAVARDPRDPAARHQGQLGVWLAAAGIGRVRYGASHGIGHQLGAVAGVPHGITSCVLLPAVLTFNAPAAPNRDSQIAAALGRPNASAAEAVRDLVIALGLPSRISELGVVKADLTRIAETSLGNAFVRANLRPIPGVDDLMAILEMAW